MTGVCVHAWKFRDDVPVRDFGPLGIKAYECAKCGAPGESDPFEGNVSEFDVSDEARRAARRPASVATTGLEVRHELLDVQTGEFLPATVENAARVLEAAREMKRKLNIVVAEATSFLLEQSQREGKRTFHSELGDVVLSGGATREYDVVTLLSGLKEADCPEERIWEAVKAELSYKVNRSVLKQLGAANPKYRAVIEAAERTVEKPFRATVKP